jgi:hypothetical protein
MAEVVKKSHSGDSLPKEVLKGSIASAIVYSGSKVMSIAVKNPVVVFGLGLVSGFLIHKYRKDIIASTTKVVDAGKDFVLQQKENLEDLVAETKES